MVINTFVVVAIITMFIMSMAVILFVVLYQRKVIRHQLELKILNTQKELEILKASIQSEEDERKRIAEELHDDVGATLSSARLFLNLGSSNGDNEQLNISKSLIDESLQKIRAVSYKLQPSSLNTLGLVSAIKNNIELLNKSGNIHATLAVDGDYHRMDKNIELHIYRIIQEIFTNLTKYSKANQLWINLQFNSLLIQIDIRHNGQGLTDESFDKLRTSTTGQGLKNIHNRLRIIKGQIAHTSESNFSSIHITIPAPHEETTA